MEVGSFHVGTTILTLTVAKCSLTMDVMVIKTTLWMRTCASGFVGQRGLQINQMMMISMGEINNLGMEMFMRMLPMQREGEQVYGKYS